MPRKKSDDPTKIITARVTSGLSDEVATWALERGVSKSEAVVLLLQDGLAAGRPVPRTRQAPANADGPCLHPMSRRLGKGCPVCGKDPV